MLPSSSLDPSASPSPNSTRSRARVRSPRGPRQQQEIERILSQLPHTPARALLAARAAAKRARQMRHPHALSAYNLLLVRAHNANGDFRAAAELGSRTAERAAALGLPQLAQRAHLEAAWAETYLGNLARARAHLQAAKRFSPPSRRAEPRQAASADIQPEGTADERALLTDWIRARIHREQGQHPRALSEFQALYDLSRSQANPIDSARILRELGLTQSRLDPTRALEPLTRARIALARAACPAEVALCDYYLAQTLIDLNRYDDARTALDAARHGFAKQNMTVLEAACDLEMGYLLNALEQYEESLRYSERARAVFHAHDEAQEESSCRVNIGWALLELNRYSEALPHFQAAEAVARRTGRKTKAAVCMLNTAGIYLRQGRYARALEQYHGARELFARAHLTERLAECDLGLGALYAQLGAPADALRMLARARRVLRRAGMSAKLGACEFQRARVLAAMGRRKPAQRALEGARALLQQHGLLLAVAACDLLWAQLERDSASAALERLAQSERAFARANLPVDVALCQLGRGELHLRRSEWQAGEDALRRAGRILNAAFPDQQWRIEYGLGRAAEGKQDPNAARQHYMRAARILANLRGDLIVESLSDGAFGARRYALDDALRFAARHGLTAEALELVETAKAQTFLRQLALGGWRRTRNAKPAVRALYARAAELRERLEDAREHNAAQFALAAGGAMGRGASPAAALGALEREYEQVVTQLRVAQSGMTGAPTLDPFDLDAFIRLANARWGDAWVALDYYLLRGQLYFLRVDPAGVQLLIRPWKQAERLALALCASTDPGVRETIYRGTLRGYRVPTDGRKLLETLAQALIPSDVLQMREERTLIVSPHGLLHQLPFHALMNEGTPLLERFSIVQAPNLQTLTQLGKAKPARRSGKWLVYGVDEFGERAEPLSAANAELEAVADVGGARSWARRGEDATRASLLQLQAADALSRCDVLHFATHAVVQPGSPHSSRILLADGDLTVLDILEIELDARLVTLAACSTAEGKPGQGDELLGLTRAFMYAGARALVASLWAVEDESTARLMRLFYQAYDAGASVAQALRRAQLAMHREGYSPFQWAPFVAIGAA